MYTFFDGLIIGIPVMVLAAWFRPLVVWGVASGVLVWVNAAACGWVDRKWDTWIAGTGFERRIFAAGIFSLIGWALGDVIRAA